jgi:hypothetical protein
MHVKKIILMTIISLPFLVTAQQNKSQEKKQKAAEKKAKI